MINKIKIIFIATIISTFAHADCKSEYRTYVARDAISSTGLAIAGIYVIQASAIPFSTAQNIMYNDPISATVLRGVGTTTIGAGGAGAGTGMSFSAHGVSLIRSMRLINQSKIGFGKDLTNITEELSIELNREVTEDEVADIINLGNQSRDFCPGTSRTPFTKKEVFNYVKEVL